MDTTTVGTVTGLFWIINLAACITGWLVWIGLL